MKKQYTRWFAALAAGALVLNASPAVLAVPTLRLTDNLANTVTVIDEAAGDTLTGFAGKVGFSGALGNWNLNIDTGTTYPFATGGTANNPNMLLSFDNIFNGAATGRTLTLEFSQIGYTLVPTTFFSSLGLTQIVGGADIAVSYQAYDGIGNLLFQQSFALGGVQNAGVTAPFSSSVTAGTQGGLVNPYSLTQVITFTYTGTGPSAEVSGSAALQSIPDGGATASLLGFSLLGMALVRRKLQAA